jgi:hypothetical protein
MHMCVFACAFICLCVSACVTIYKHIGQEVDMKIMHFTGLAARLSYTPLLHASLIITSDRRAT